MTIHPEVVPWPLWLALALALLVAGKLLGARINPEHPLVPFGAGLLVGLALSALR